MQKIDANALVKDLPVLSSLPAVIEELEKALDKGDASMQDLGEIVKKDTDLTARLLRLANSSFYGFPKGVETVAEALSLIGLEQMKQLLTGSSVMEYFGGIPASSVNMRSFWEHSIATGIAAKVLSILRRSTEPELFFVCGLIHDIGRLVFYTQLPKDSEEVIRLYQLDERIPLYQVEKENYGVDHGAVGGKLLKKWDFPNSLVDAVKFHHFPEQAEHHFPETSLIHVADYIVHAIGLGNSGERLVPELNMRAWKRLDLPMSALRTTIRETEKQYDEVVSLFIK